MNKYLRYALPLALSTLVMAGCKDEDSVEVGQWDSSTDYAVVAFKEITQTVELDPAAETTYTLHMTRRHPQLSELLDSESNRVGALIDDLKDQMADELEAEEADLKEQLAAEDLTDEEKAEIQENYEEACAAIQKKYQDQIDALQAQYKEYETTQCNANLEAIEVPITITNGTEDIFTISSAKFEKGAWDAEYTISFPKAEVGVTYEVQYAVKDPRYVSSYSDAATATFSVTRVKWVPVGNGVLTDYFWFEGSNPVEVVMKDGDNTKFRIMHPFNTMAAGYQSVETSEYVELTLLKVGQTLKGVKISNEDLVYFTPVHTGYVHPDYHAEVVVWHPADLYSSPSEDMYLASKVLGYTTVKIDGKDYKVPGAINLAPYFYMSGVGGWNRTTDTKCVQLVMDGFKLTYEADLFTPGDFEWEKVFEGVFTSKQMSSTSTASLYRGNCVATTDDADKTFTAKYGVPYILEAPYAEDYDIIFFVKDGRIQMPKDYDDDLGLQPIGIDAAGMPVYVTINGSSSTFKDNEVTLNMTFQAEREYINDQGRKAYEYITLDTNDETLANITWNPVGTGTYYYMDYDDEDNVIYHEDPGYVILQRQDSPDMFMVEEWYSGGTLEFTWDQTTNAVSVPMCDTGDTYGDYGTVYASDVANCPYSSARGWTVEDYPTFYDAESSTFVLRLVYFVNGGTFGIYDEKMVVDWTASEVKAPMLKKQGRTMPHYFKLQQGAKVLGKYANYTKHVGKSTKTTVRNRAGKTSFEAKTSLVKF